MELESTGTASAPSCLLCYCCGQPTKPREANGCADFLANLGHESNSPMYVLHSVPPLLASLVAADARGASFPRLMGVK